MKINLNDLREIFEIILKNIEEEFPNEVNLDKTTYWTLFYEDKYNIKQPEPLIGSLKDDWDFLKKMQKDKDLPLYLMPERLGNIIQALGYKVDRYNDQV